jgi:hypothetical protein
VEKQPTAEELAAARRRAEADAQAHLAAQRSGGRSDEPPGQAGPYAFAAEALQAEYDLVYRDTLARLRSDRD